MDVEAIQQGLADAAAHITGLNTYPSLPDAIEPPTFAPVELELTYHQTFGGLSEILFTCGLYVSRGDSEAGRELLVGFLDTGSATSIAAALEADATLGGAAKALIVERARGAYRLYTIAGIDYLGTNFDVRVWS